MCDYIFCFIAIVAMEAFRKGHGFIGYPKARNVERALGPSCPCVLCIPIHIITINIESFLGCHISHSLGQYLLHQISLKRERVARQSLLALRARALAKFGEVDTVPVSEKYTKHRGNSVLVLSRHFDI